MLPSSTHKASLRKQIILMTDGSFKAAGYVLLTEEITSTSKAYAPVALGSEKFTPSQMKIYANDF